MIVEIDNDQKCVELMWENLLTMIIAMAMTVIFQIYFYYTESIRQSINVFVTHNVSKCWIDRNCPKQNKTKQKWGRINRWRECSKKKKPNWKCYKLFKQYLNAINDVPLSYWLCFLGQAYSENGVNILHIASLAECNKNSKDLFRSLFLLLLLYSNLIFYTVFTLNITHTHTKSRIEFECECVEWNGEIKRVKKKRTNVHGIGAAWLSMVSVFSIYIKTHWMHSIE